jgi:hypothetical protein
MEVGGQPQQVLREKISRRKKKTLVLGVQLGGRLLIRV